MLLFLHTFIHIYIHTYILVHIDCQRDRPLNVNAMKSHVQLNWPYLHTIYKCVKKSGLTFTFTKAVAVVQHQSVKITNTYAKYLFPPLFEHISISVAPMSYAICLVISYMQTFSCGKFMTV